VPFGFASGGSNLYGYVLNDPVNLVDVFGLQKTLGQSLSGLWDKIMDGTIGRDVLGGVKGGAKGVGGFWNKRGDIADGIGNAFNNAHPAAQGCLIVAGAITITPVVEATVIPAIETGYGYVMSNPDKAMIAIDLAIGYFDGNPPNNAMQSIGKGLNESINYLINEYKNYDPYWLEKSAIFNKVGY